MGKILRATKNELIKLFSKKSIYILLIVGAILAAAPIVLNKLTDVLQKNNDKIYMNYNYDFERKEINSVLSKTSQIADEKQKQVIEKLAKFRLTQLDELVKNDFKVNTWQRDIFENIQNMKLSKYVAELLLEGYGYNQIIEESKQLYLNIDNNLINIVDNNNELKKYVTEQDSNITKYSEIISSDNYYEYLRLQNVELEKDKKSSMELIENLQKTLNKENESIDKDQFKIEDLQKQIDNFNYYIENENMIIKTNEYIISNEIKYDVNNWKFNTIDRIKNESMNLFNTKSNKMTEKDYYLNDYSNDSKNVPYDKYLESYDKGIKNIEDELNKYWYALENNIPINEKNAKEATKSLYDNLLVVLVIIIAGEIVAKEFTTGTIRLTLTRPIKRWKILLAKLLTCYIMIIIFAVITYLFAILAGGILYGFSSFGIPELIVGANGAILEQSFLLIALKNLVICLLPAVFFVTLAFMLSTITKSSALAVGISIGGLFAASIANMIILFNPMKWMQYTPLPYANFANFLGSMSDTIVSNNIKYGMNINIGSGSLMLLAYIVIFLVISFMTFTKTDIKNQ